MFFLGYYRYLVIPSFLVFIMPIKKTKIILLATHQNVFPNQILKKSSAKKIDNFLKILEKTLKKKNG